MNPSLFQEKTSPFSFSLESIFSKKIWDSFNVIFLLKFCPNVCIKFLVGLSQQKIKYVRLDSTPNNCKSSPFLLTLVLSLMAALAAAEPCLDDLESWSGVMPMSFRMSASCRALIPQLLATFFWQRLCTFVRHAANGNTQHFWLEKRFCGNVS